MLEGKDAGRRFQQPQERENSWGNSVGLSPKTRTDPSSQRKQHTWVMPRKPHAKIPSSPHAQDPHCAFEQIRKSCPLQADAATCQGTQPGKSMDGISTPAPLHPRGCPCATNTLHDSIVSFFVPVERKNGLDAKSILGAGVQWLLLQMHPRQTRPLLPAVSI